MRSSFFFADDLHPQDEARSDVKSLADQELLAWEKLGREATKLNFDTLGPEDERHVFGTYLRMPLYQDVPSDITAELLVEKIKIEIDRFKKAGVIHKDLLWRHVKWDGEKVEVRFVDLGYCEFVDSDSSAMIAWVNEGKESVRAGTGSSRSK